MRLGAWGIVAAWALAGFGLVNPARVASSPRGRLVLVRHGRSTWNDLNLFTGFADPSLSKWGIQEALLAGRLLKECGIHPDIAFVSRLQRADQTLRIVLNTLGDKPPVVQSWRLNEQHCGALTGWNKRDLALTYGEEQVFQWRRNPRVRPPPASDLLPEVVARLGSRIARVEHRRSCLLAAPKAESLLDACARFRPLWRHGIRPLLRKGQTVLVAGHGNMLRGAIREIEGLSDDELMRLELPQATPLVYDFFADLAPRAPPEGESELFVRSSVIKGAFLGDETRVRAAQTRSALAHAAGPRLPPDISETDGFVDRHAGQAYVALAPVGPIRSAPSDRDLLLP